MGLLRVGGFDTQVAIVGGGPAGAALHLRLARAGIESIVFERSTAPRWRACGVFASPLVRRRLVDLDMPSATVESLARPIDALDLTSTRGAHCRLEYLDGHACGFDRVRLDARLLALARAAGEVRTGTVVRDIDLSSGSLRVSSIESNASEVISAEVIVGADGLGSRVARAAGVESRRNWLGRSAITFHHSDPASAPEGAPMTARFVLGDGWYAGIAPVPAGRVNVGIVVPTARLRGGAEQATQRVLRALPVSADEWQSAARTDSLAVAGRLEHHVTRAAGPNWLLVGDAVGFIDPITGEGLHRALVSAELAAEAIGRALRGDRLALAVYDRRVRSRFRSKNVVSLILQAFVSRPAALDYALRRLASRTSLRDDLTRVLTDQIPATRALDPRFLAGLLRP